MLSAAKHLCSSSQILEPKATAEILRYAQDDSRLIFSHLLRHSSSESKISPASGFQRLKADG
jgi:hypothetical protein